MAWSPDYATLSALKAVLRIADTDDDAALALALSGASRAIDDRCGRQFGKLEDPAARYYSARWDLDRCRWVVQVDDLMDTDDLAIAVRDTEGGEYSRTLELGTDLELHPLNAAADGRPWTRLLGLRGGAALPAGEGAIRVTARWGWSAVPAQVEQATLIQATRLFRRKDAPFGIAGSPETGGETRLLARLDPDVALMVKPLRRMWGAV